MKKYKIITLLLTFNLLVCIFPSALRAQQTLLFGTMKVEGKVSQARFEVDPSWKSIVYAPYGITPITFSNIVKTEKQLTFNWQYKGLPYRGVLLKGEGVVYQGTCTSEKGAPIELVMREFTEEDARLQGNMLPASKTELQILDRALALLHNGSNWSRSDNRICDNSSYPYQWSLFCALHQASMDVDTEYRHLRPAVQATRQAIEEATKGKKFAHLLQDFNNEAPSFASIAGVLNRAKEIIAEKMKNQK